MQGPAFFSNPKGAEAKYQEEVLQCVMVPIPKQKFLKLGTMSMKMEPKKFEKRFVGCFRNTLVLYKKEKDELAYGALALVGSTVTVGTKDQKKVIEILSPLAFVLRGSERDEFRGKSFFLFPKQEIELNEWYDLLIRQNQPAKEKRAALAPISSQILSENNWVLDSQNESLNNERRLDSQNESLNNSSNNERKETIQKGPHPYSHYDAPALSYESTIDHDVYGGNLMDDERKFTVTQIMKDKEDDGRYVSKTITSDRYDDYDI